MGKSTIRFITYRQIGESIQVYLMSDPSGQEIVIQTIIWWWQRLGKEQQ
jgi:hypothetical protein